MIDRRKLTANQLHKLTRAYTYTNKGQTESYLLVSLQITKCLLGFQGQGSRVRVLGLGLGLLTIDRLLIYYDVIILQTIFQSCESQLYRYRSVDTYQTIIVRIQYLIFISATTSTLIQYANRYKYLSPRDASSVAH